MYDAKQVKDKKNDTTRNNCISERCYFKKPYENGIVNLKSGYVPRENIFY